MLDGYHNMWGMHWGWWIFWLVVIVFMVFILSGSRGRQASSAATEKPLDILKRRYASGEISTEEYEERKARLKEPN